MLNKPMADVVFGQSLRELLELLLKFGQEAEAEQDIPAVTAARSPWAAMVEIMEYAQ